MKRPAFFSLYSKEDFFLFLMGSKEELVGVRAAPPSNSTCLLLAAGRGLRPANWSLVRIQNQDGEAERTIYAVPRGQLQVSKETWRHPGSSESDLVLTPCL